MTRLRNCNALFLLIVSGLATGVRAQVPAAAGQSQDLGAAPGGMVLRVDVRLAPTAEKQEALRELLNAQMTQGTSAYQHWLTVAEFAAKFGADAGAVRSFAAKTGLAVDSIAPGGLGVTLRGTVAQMEAAFAPGLHLYATAKGTVVADTLVPTAPAGLSVLAVRGFDAVSAETATLGDEAGVHAGDALELLGAAADAGVSRVLSLRGLGCAADVGEVAAMRLAAAQAAAEGMTVIAESACADGRVSVLGDSADVVVVAGTNFGGPSALKRLEDDGEKQATASVVRPFWQAATGLPVDGLRAAPDFSVSSVEELAAALRVILQTVPADASGARGRLGNVGATLYALAPVQGLFTQADGAAAGTWEQGTGLGVVDLAMLEKVFPRAALTDNVQISSSNYSPTHGQTFTLSANVTDTSGQGMGVAPTGTVTFTASNGTTLGSCTLANGVCNAVISNAPGGSLQIKAYYTGDGTYAGNTSVTITVSVQGEELTVTPTVSNSPAVGGTIIVSVTVTSPSGVGTPSGTVNVTPQGTAQTTTYSGPLAGSGATATATIQVPATMAGNIVLVVQCVTTDPSFTCYKAYNISATVTQATPTMKFTVTPNPPVTGQVTMFSATVTGAATPAVQPSGTVTFYDNGSVIGSGQVNNGTATAQVSGLSATAAHSFTAQYGGDNNYKSATASAPGGSTLIATATTLTVNPNPPVTGATTTLTATVGYSTNGTAATGTVTFYQDGAVLGTAALAANGQAVYTSPAITGTAAHSFYAVYAGDGNYATSTSPAVATAASGKRVTTTQLVINPNPPVSGQTTTLTATVAYNSTGTAATGNVVFYQDGAVVATVPVAANGQASYSSTAIAGTTSHAFNAVYAGDTNYATSTSSTVTTAANGTTATATVLTLTPNPPVAGQATILRATVASGGTVATAATGTVMFQQDGVTIGTGTLTNGVASYSAASLDTTSAHSYTAQYLGDSTYQASQSAAVATAGTGATGTTTTTLVTSSGSQTSGGSTTFTATVTPAALVGGVAPTGTVTFTSNVQGVIGAGTVNAAGQATLTTTLTTVGAQMITATYGGDTRYTGSTSAAATVVVAAGAATQTLTLSPTTGVTAGSLVTATYTVTSSGGTPTGTVTFTSAATGFVSSTQTLVAAGANTATASYAFAAPAAGSYTILAQPTCAVSTTIVCPITPVTASLTVGAAAKIATTTTLVATPSTLTAGGVTTLQATVSPAAGATAAATGPTGTVTFYDNGVSLGMGTLTGGVATLTVTLSSTTTHVITAVYAGDTNYATSTSTALLLSTPPVVTTSTLTARPTTALQGANVIFTVTVGVPTPTTTPATYSFPTGTVTFYDTYNGQTTSLGTAPLVSSGPYQAIGQVSTTGLFVGTHTVYALYAATGVFGASSSNAVTVNITDYTLTLTPQTININDGGTAIVTATVTPQNGFSGTVTLGCTAPSGTYTTCVVTPTVLTPGGSSTITITTTAPRASLERPVVFGPAGGLGAVMAAGLVWLLVPRRRRMVALMAVVLSFGAVFGAAGCGTGLQNNFTGSTLNGTPLGTLLFQVVSSGTDGNTTNRHNLQVQATVQ